MLRFLWFLPAEKCRPCNRSSPAAEDFPTLKNSFWEVMGTSYRREDLPSLCSDRKEPLSQLHKKRPDPNVKAALTPLASSFLPYRSCQCFSWLQAHKQDGLGTGIASWLSCSWYLPLHIPLLPLTMKTTNAAVFLYSLTVVQTIQQRTEFVSSPKGHFWSKCLN